MNSTHSLHTQHSRVFDQNRFVYPVLSRRSGGISIGVNLNPDKICNFDCIYCQVDRTTQSETRFVEMAQLLGELDQTLELVTSGALFEDSRFFQVPAHLRRLNDIAFSGDGEPTTYRNFDEIIQKCAELKQNRGLPQVKMVLITNASMFHRSHVQRGLATLHENQGEVWAKLDAGSEAYFQKIERTKCRFDQILENITAVARQWPIVIQSMFLRADGAPPTAEERMAYCQRLNEITDAGGEIRLVQVYTVARRPAESYVTPLTDQEVDQIVQQTRTSTGLTVEGFYGSHHDDSMDTTQAV